MLSKKYATGRKFIESPSNGCQITEAETVKQIQRLIATGTVLEGEALPKLQSIYPNIFIPQHLSEKILLKLQSQGIVHKDSDSYVKIQLGAQRKCQELCQKRALKGLEKLANDAILLDIPPSTLLQAITQTFNTASVAPIDS